MICQRCKQDLPTAEVRFFQNVGKMFLHEVSRIRGRFCQTCAAEWYRKFTGTTLRRGWWSPSSVLVVPFFVIWNTYYLLKSRFASRP